MPRIPIQHRLSEWLDDVAEERVLDLGCNVLHKRNGKEPGRGVGEGGRKAAPSQDDVALWIDGLMVEGQQGAQFVFKHGR